MLDTAARATVDVVVLAGDIFDHNRVPVTEAERAARLIEEAGRPVVILPGNHDCLAPGSVYEAPGFRAAASVHVLGLGSESIVFDALGLEVVGRPHRRHEDMTPLQPAGPRRTPWRVAVAHGHYAQDGYGLGRAFLIRDHDLVEADADYVALGHWDHYAHVGDPDTPAYYAGSPHHTGAVNLVTLDGTGVHISRLPLEG